MTELSLPAFAKTHGVWKSAAQKWRDAGHLVMRGSKVQVEASDAKLQEASLGRYGTRQRAAAAGGGEETPAEAAERIVTATGADMSKAEAERVKENYLAHMRRLEYDLKVGTVVLIDDVVKIASSQYAATRTKLLAIPSGHSARLARISDPAVMNAELSRLLTEALNELCETAVERAARAPSDLTTPRSTT